MNLAILKERLRANEEHLQRRKWEYEKNEQELMQTQESLNRIQKEIEYTQKEKALLFRASEWARRHSIEQCNHMITNALQFILGKDIRCEAVITERYGKPSLDFVITSQDGGMEVSGSLENTRGGGTWEILGLILQIVLDRQGPFIIDEKTRALSEDYVPSLYAFLKQVCQNLGCQMIVVTHVRQLIESGDRIFEAIRPGYFKQRSIN